MGRDHLVEDLAQHLLRDRLAVRHKVASKNIAASGHPHPTPRPAGKPGLGALLRCLTADSAAGVRRSDRRPLLDRRSDGRSGRTAAATASDPVRDPSHRAGPGRRRYRDEPRPSPTDRRVGRRQASIMSGRRNDYVDACSRNSRTASAMSSTSSTSSINPTCSSHTSAGTAARSSSSRT